MLKMSIREEVLTVENKMSDDILGIMLNLLSDTQKWEVNIKYISKYS